MMGNDPYFSYICSLALGKNKNDYKKLCGFLYDTPFMYILDMDENRELDGLLLRKTFMESNPDYDMERSLRPDLNHMCSVLEMMVALAKRCHNSIIDAPGSGEGGPYELFSLMLDNMGLDRFTDDRFSQKAVERIVTNMLDRNYPPDGKGSMFYIPGIERDMREAEIWYQAMWYIDSIMN